MVDEGGFIDLGRLLPGVLLVVPVVFPVCRLCLLVHVLFSFGVSCCIKPFMSCSLNLFLCAARLLFHTPLKSGTRPCSLTCPWHSHRRIGGQLSCKLSVPPGLRTDRAAHGVDPELPGEHLLGTLFRFLFRLFLHHGRFLFCIISFRSALRTFALFAGRHGTAHGVDPVLGVHQFPGGDLPGFQLFGLSHGTISLCRLLLLP